VYHQASQKKQISGAYNQFGYDTFDRLQTLQYPDQQTVTYGYDNISRIKNVQYTGMNTVVYDYPTTLDTNKYTIQYPNGLTQEKITDAFKELKSQTHLMNNTANWSETFGYDGMGNIKKIERNNAIFSYDYDGLNRIKTEDGATGHKGYTYDVRGNRLTMEGANLPNTVMGNQEFSYNAVNQLKTFSNDTGVSASYSYYGDGLRAAKSVNGDTTRYIYLNGKVIEELGAGGNVKARNIWGNGLLYRQDYTNNRGGYYLYNGHGDVVKIADNTGEVIKTYDYDIWGNVLTETTPNPNKPFNNPFKYTGEPQDDESGLIYLRARYYDPTIGRFISQDTVEGDLNNPLSLNLYTYVQNNPLRYTDPSGHSAWGAVKSFASGAWNTAASAISNGIYSDDTNTGDSGTAYAVGQVVGGAAAVGVGIVETYIGATGVGVGIVATPETAGAGALVIAPSAAAATVGVTTIGYAVNGIADGVNNLSSDGMGEGIVYKRTNKTGEDYIGQAKNEERFKERQKEHDRSNPDAEYKFKEEGRAEPGKELNILEQKKINKNGGLQKDGGPLQNKRNQISEKKWEENGIEPPNR
jgi:RHS repeat-associated protein